jgi:RNA polymerase-binding transcription factor DksA
VDGETTAARLHEERRRVAEQVDALQTEFDAIVSASEFTASDDEHDPDGATIGFERAQASALLDRAQRRLEALDRALARLDAGTYGRCERCGAAIAPERLEALPDATECVHCAARR